MHWSQTESSKWSLNCLLHDLGRPFIKPYGFSVGSRVFYKEIWLIFIRIFIHIQPRSASPDRTRATCDSGHVPRCSALRGQRGRSSWVRDGDRDQRDRSCTCGASLGPHPVAQACVQRKQAGSGFRLLRRLLPYSASGPAHPSSILKLAASPPQGKLRPPASLSH